MSDIDKTIRIGVDSSAAEQGASRVRDQIDRTNSTSVDGLKEQIRLLKEKGAIEDELARRRTRSAQEDIRYAERELQIWKLQREEESRGLKGKEKKRFDSSTSTEESAARLSLLRDKGTFADTRNTAEDDKNDRKKQIKKLEELSDTIRGESKKERESQQSLLEKVLTTAGVGPNTAKSISDISNSPTGKIVKALYGISLAAASAEEGLKQYTTNMNQRAATSVYQSIKGGIGSWGGSASQVLGKTSARFLEDDYAKYQSAYGDKNLRGGIAEGMELAGAERSRGISKQSIEQILSISRYSGSSSTNQISSMENYLQKTGQSLVRLPEIMTSYLNIANGILVKTGQVDPVAVARMMQSVGSSYGVSGMNLDRMSAGFQAMGTYSGNPILSAIQQQTLRKLHPGMSNWDRMKMLENPFTDPNYLPMLTESLKKMGGGKDFGKMAFKDLMQGQGYDIPTSDVDKIFAGKLKVSDPSFKDKADFYTKESQGQVGDGSSSKAAFGELGNTIVKGLSVVFMDGLGKIFGSEYGDEQRKNMEKAFDNSLNKNKQWLQNR